MIGEIQAALMEEGLSLGPVFLKLRYLAARLGSDHLEEWVKHESEGYPSGSPVPEYRKVPVSYRGNFFGPFGSGVENAPIPTALISKYAGKNWVYYDIRQSIAAIDDLISDSKNDDKSGSLRINASNLILLLQGKVYEGYSCNSVDGSISTAELVAVQHVVRTRILEFTLELEKCVPEAVDIVLGHPSNDVAKEAAQTVTQITNQVIHGNMTSISTNGDANQITLQIGKRDRKVFQETLEGAGIASDDAKELTEIITSEEGLSADQPWGPKAKSWLAKNIGKAADGTWKIGLNVATNILTEAAMKYYGFK